MKKIFLIFILVSLVVNTGFSDYKPLRLRDLSPKERKEAIIAYLNGNCEYKGIKLYGKVRFVNAFEDIKIRFVDSFEDINVRFVTAFPNSCGEWQKVDAFEDFSVRVVDSFEDIKVRVVTNFPGMD